MEEEPMVSTAMAAEVTSALRDLSTEVESQGRALGSSVRHLVSSAGLRPPTAARVRIARDLSIPPAQVLGWVASALDAAGSLLGSQAVDHPDEPGERLPTAVVDRALTRC
jgi:hypothetical protein